MKRKVLIGLSIAILIAVCCLNLIFALEPNPNPTPDDGGGDSGSDGSLWNRYDVNCNDPLKPWREKTFCSSGGSEACSPRYCN